MTVSRSLWYSTLRTIQKNGLAATKGFIENILYSCSIHSYGSASSVIVARQKTRQRYTFFVKSAKKNEIFLKKISVSLQLSDNQQEKIFTPLYFVFIKMLYLQRQTIKQ